MPTGAVAAGAFVTCGAGGTVATGTQANAVGVATRAGDAGATPPVPCRWLAYK